MAMQRMKIMNLRVRSNQSLKLTEPAVDDFVRAKQPVPCWT